MLDINIFDEKYTNDTTVLSEVMCPESQEGMFETYGADVEHVWEVANKSPLRVWTAMDSDSGFILVNGFHYVNRVYYLITNEEASDENEEYLIDSYSKCEYCNQEECEYSCDESQAGGFNNDD